jgi:serine/threonine protein kinase
MMSMSTGGKNTDAAYGKTQAADDTQAMGVTAAERLPTPRAAVGRLGEFRLLREVGRGGMGIVYEAEQESLGRRVAIKVLPAGALSDPKQVRRFEREARAAARLHHANIVPVFGVGELEGTLGIQLGAGSLGCRLSRMG